MLSTVRKWVLQRVWYVHAPVVLLATVSTRELLALLEDAAKPSHDRLHLQEVFTSGRRYQITKKQAGFDLLTTSRSYWRYTESWFGVRKRTRSAARLSADTLDLDAGITRLEIRTHFRLGYLLDVVWVPLFFTTIVVAMPWPWWVLAVVVLALFGLSFAYHYQQAAHQANEMLFFLDKALADVLIHSLPELEATASGEVVYMNDAFADAWEKFYQSHRDEANP